MVKVIKEAFVVIGKEGKNLFEEAAKAICSGLKKNIGITILV